MIFRARFRGILVELIFVQLRRLDRDLLLLSRIELGFVLLSNPAHG